MTMFTRSKSEVTPTSLDTTDAGTCPAKVAQSAFAPARIAAPSRGLAAMFGLDVRASMLAVLVDLMVFAGDTFSLETLLPLGIGVAAVLGVIVYKIQRKWSDDDHESALIKALTIGLL